jgi:hypothetical protein
MQFLKNNLLILDDISSRQLRNPSSYSLWPVTIFHQSSNQEAKALPVVITRSSLVKMRVVGLVSGGKDSCYAMMQCVAAGHTLVALANLQPETDGTFKILKTKFKQHQN